jgi:hypothetical protein
MSADRLAGLRPYQCSVLADKPSARASGQGVVPRYARWCGQYLIRLRAVLSGTTTRNREPLPTVERTDNSCPSTSAVLRAIHNPKTEALPLRISLVQLAENSLDAFFRNADAAVVDLDPHLGPTVTAADKNTAAVCVFDLVADEVMKNRREHFWITLDGSAATEDPNRDPFSIAFVDHCSVPATTRRKAVRLRQVWVPGASDGVADRADEAEEREDWPQRRTARGRG